MKSIFKILSLCLTLLILTRSVSLYAFCTNENAFASKSQKSELQLVQSSNYALVITDRTKSIDNSQPQKSKHGSPLLDYHKLLIDKANTTIQFSQSDTFQNKTENKIIFKEHYLTFPFHNFY